MSPHDDQESVIEKTDIGGPTMIRSAAKGCRIVVVDPMDRAKVIGWLKAGKPDAKRFKNLLAAKAEGVIADYCLASARYRAKTEGYNVYGSLTTDIEIPIY